MHARHGACHGSGGEASHARFAHDGVTLMEMPYIAVYHFYRVPVGVPGQAMLGSGGAPAPVRGPGRAPGVWMVAVRATVSRRQLWARRWEEEIALDGGCNGGAGPVTSTRRRRGRQALARTAAGRCGPAPGLRRFASRVGVATDVDAVKVGVEVAGVVDRVETPVVAGQFVQAQRP